MIELLIELVRILGKPVADAASGETFEHADKIEAERQALILAQRRIQEEIARRELPP